MIKYEIINKESGKVENELVIDQCGTILRIVEGWNCEGGGGSEQVCSDNYIVNLVYYEK